MKGLDGRCFDLLFEMHEDIDAPGFYMYEIADDPGMHVGEKIIEAVRIARISLSITTNASRGRRPTADS